MLNQNNVIATVAVKDLKNARDFYEKKLGLKRTEDGDEEVATYKSGNSTLFVYKSSYAGTNKATGATWTVEGDIEGVVKSLKDKGVSFEHYDMPGMKREGDLHIAGTMKAAWFKDPDGNILGLITGG